MTNDDGDYVFSHDAATIAFDSVTSGGITVDDEGDAVEFDWNEVPLVEVDEPPHAHAFDTNEFYKIEGATTARPIKQPYSTNDDVEVYVKPADELRQAAWSMDNRPYVLGHPDTGMVKDVRDVHGFWRNPRYDDDEDRLKEDLYIPKDDDEAKEFIAENDDVSLGFYNLLTRDYDGDIGGLVDGDDLDDVDEFQVNIYVDHVAGVERGRCSSEHGCGLDDTHDHGQVVMQTDPTDSMEYQIKSDSFSNEDGWFAVAPDENVDEQPKFPINNCSDVQDAWQLRGSGDIDIDQSTLESRIQDRARDLGCEVPGMDDNSDASDNKDTDSNMTDDDNPFDIPDLSIDAIAEKHEEVRELRDAKDTLESDLDEVREGLGLDEDECPCDADLDEYAEARETVDDLRDEFDEDVDLVDFVQDMHEEWKESRDEKRDGALDRLEELKADREEWEDASLDEMEEEIERREEIAEDFDASAPKSQADSDPDKGGSEMDMVAGSGGRQMIPRGAR